MDDQTNLGNKNLNCGNGWWLRIIFTTVFLMLITSCTAGGSVVRSTIEASVEATEFVTLPTQTPQIETTEPTSMPTLLPSPTVEILPTATIEPTEVPTVVPTNTLEPTPEVIVAEGEVLYEYADADSAETVRVALPESWANLLEGASEVAGKMYRGEVPIAHPRVEGDTLMVGQIPVAVKNESGEWQANEQVFLMESYLGFGPALGYVDSSGAVDVSEVAPNGFRNLEGGARTVEGGLGSVGYNAVDNITPIKYVRTRIITLAEGNLVETAMMDITLAYRGFDGAGVATVNVQAHGSITSNNKLYDLSEWTPNLGELYKSAGFVYVIDPGDSEETRREWALQNNVVWLFAGVPELQPNSGYYFGGPTMHYPRTFFSDLNP